MSGFSSWSSSYWMSIEYKGKTAELANKLPIKGAHKLLMLEQSFTVIRFQTFVFKQVCFLLMFPVLNFSVFVFFVFFYGKCKKNCHSALVILCWWKDEDR